VGDGECVLCRQVTSGLLEAGILSPSAGATGTAFVMVDKSPGMLQQARTKLLAL
jgi:hypothetical protein